MQRKYIYLLVIFLTIVLVVYNHFVGLSSKKPSVELNNSPTIEETQKNTEVKYNLQIDNFQNDEQDIIYSYKITIPEISGAYKYSKNNEESYLIFAANGEAEITLNSNSSLTIYDLPEGIKYKIEQITDVSEKYTTKVDEKESAIVEGTISETNNIKFSNETIISEEPVKKNPFTSDNHYLALFVFVYAIIITIIATRIKVKRFE